MLGSGYQNNMGAVAGYGLSLQERCLEGFNSLGFHHFRSVSIDGDAGAL